MNVGFFVSPSETVGFARWLVFEVVELDGEVGGEFVNGFFCLIANGVVLGFFGFNLGRFRFFVEKDKLGKLFDVDVLDGCIRQVGNAVGGDDVGMDFVNLVDLIGGELVPWAKLGIGWVGHQEE